MSFSLKMDAQEASSSNNITFDSGTVILSNFTVVGDRALADDYEFTRTFPTGLAIDLENVSVLSELLFDVPQGEYERMTVRFETSYLYVRAHYVSPGPAKIESTIHFRLDKPKQFEVNITDSLGNTYLRLNESVAENPQIIFEPKSWFDLIPETMFENATVFYVNNHRIINIGSNDNQLIYSIINQYIGQSAKCFLHP